MTALCLGGCAQKYKIPKKKSETPIKEETPAPAPKLKLLFHKKELLGGAKGKEQFCYFEVEDEGSTDVYRLVRHSINDKMECLGSFVRNDKNLLCWEENPDQLYLVTFYGFFPGEPVEYYIVSVDDRRVSKLHLVPSPMEVTKKNGYKLSAEIATPDGLTFIFNASGFEPHELVNGAARTENVIEDFRLTANEEGRLTFTINPDWTKDRGGKAEIELTGSKGRISMTYPWGANYLHWAESQMDE
jgi:hypothetical protein